MIVEEIRVDFDGGVFVVNAVRNDGEEDFEGTGLTLSEALNELADEVASNGF